MPSGKTHLHIEITALIVICVGGGALNYHYGWMKWDEVIELAPFFVGGYLFSSLLLSPDLDLAVSGPQHRWWIFGILWKPYAHLFHHRGISHNPLFGPVTRIGYLGLIVAGVLAGLHYGMDMELKFLEHWWKDLQGMPLYALMAGLFLPNELHIVADHLFKN